MSAHHELGPSQWARLWNCAGSAALCASLPPDPEGKAAWEGTCAHALLERCALELEFDSSVFVDLPMEAKGRTFTVTKEHTHVNMAMGLLDTLLEADPAASYWVETKLDISHIWPGLFGTADLVVYQPHTLHLHVIDYKHGAGVAVSAEGNKQTRGYALGALNTFKHLEPETVTCWIVQPRCAHGGDPVRSESYDALDLTLFASEARQKLAATQCAGAPRVPGEWCRSTFCRGASQMACPEFKAAGEAHLNEHFLPQQPQRCSPEELGERLSALPQIRAYVKSLEEYAFNQAMQGNFPKGFNFYEGRGSRSWKEPASGQNIDVATAVRLATGAVILEQKLMTVPQAEKLIGKKVFEEKCANFVETTKSTKLEKEAPGKTPLSLIEVQSRSKADAFETQTEQ